MHSVTWRHLAKDNKLISETIYEVSNVRVIEYDERDRPKNIEIVTSGFGTLNAVPLAKLKQRIYVMNDMAKTIAVYDIPKAE